MDFFQSPDFFTHQIKHLLGSIRHEDSKTWIFPRWNESGSGPSDTNFPSNICIYIYIYMYINTKYHSLFCCQELPTIPESGPWLQWPSTLQQHPPPGNSWQAKPQPLRLGIGGQKNHQRGFFEVNLQFLDETPGQEMMVAHLYQLPEGWFLPNWINSVNSRGLQSLQHPSDPSELHPLKKQAIIASNERSLKHDISTCHQPVSIQ